MVLTKNSNGPGRKLIVVIGIIMLVVLAGIIGWNLFKYKFIKSKVNSAMYEKTNGLYTIRYDKMNLDEVGGYLFVTNLQIIPDTTRFRQLIKDKKNPPLLLSLFVPELTIAGVKTPEAVINKSVSGRKLEINNATVRFYYAKAAPDTATDAVKQEMYQQLLGDLKSISADTIDVKHISLSFVNMLTNQSSVEASDISVLLNDVQIDSLHSNDSTRFFFSKKIVISGDSAVIKNKPGTYFYRFNGFSFNSEGGVLGIKSLQIEPQLGEQQFAAFAKIQTDRFDISLKDIALKNINLRRLMLTDIIADSLVIQNGNFKIFRDRNYPGDKVNRVGQFPQQLLMKMPVLLALKKTLIKNAFIEYKEKNPKSDYNGKIQFINARAVIDNITNVPALIKANNSCVLTFNASFLDLAKMHVRLNLLLNNPRGKFLFSGGLDEGFNATGLNKLIEPMGLARVEKGNVQHLDFNFVGHNYGSDGKVTLLYDDLKLNLLKKDEDDNKLEKKQLASFLANIIIKNSNPTRKQAPRVAKVHYERNTNRSFFNLMWKSVFTGIKQTAGM
ncbi:MAG: hypothetical protein ABIU63_04715 [Chitinophagaceae bacterium]